MASRGGGLFLGCRYLLQLPPPASDAAEHPAPIDTQASPSERMAFDSQNVVKKEKREENFWIHIGIVLQQLWIKKEVAEEKEICCLHHDIKFTLSAAAQADRQLACCVFPLISHISLWRDIIPDDCLSVMVYDEKCSGPLM